MASIILYSGGMDSYMLAHEYPEAKGVYYDLGGRYSEFEKKNIRRLNRGIKTHNLNLSPVEIRDLGFYPKDFEEDGGYIPYRNLVLILRASMEEDVDTIYFGVVNEWQRDKSRKFVRLIENIMSDMGKKRITVKTPYRGKSKSKLLDNFISSGGDVELMLKYSRSCVSDSKQECGVCVSCNSKYIAFVNNGIDLSKHFAKKPSIENYIQERLSKSFAKDFRFERLPSTAGRLYEAAKAKRHEKSLRD